MQGVRLRRLAALLRVHAALLVDEHRFAGTDVPQQLEAGHVERDALGRDHVLAAARALAGADDERADAVRIAETEHAVPEDHGDDGVAAANAPVGGAHRGEDVRGRRARRADALQLARQHVQQDFRVGRGVEVPAVLAHQHVRQRPSRWSGCRCGQGRCRRARSRRTAAPPQSCRSPRSGSARGRCRHCPSAAPCAAAGRRRARGRCPCACTARLHGPS